VKLENPMNIKIDHRESNGNLLSALRQEKNIQLEICQLAVGNYQVDDLLLVERKTIPDLYVSIKDGRWFRQAKQLSSHPIQPMIILEGSSASFQTVGMKREAVQGALISLSLIFKIPLIRSRSPQETAKLILYAARQLLSFGCHSRTVRHLPFSPHKKNNYKRQIHVLQGFPGIGPTRARLLMERYGTLKEVLSALTNGPEEIPGIGQKTIQNLIQVIE
jgi:ERCC4-type nuclease